MTDIDTDPVAPGPEAPVGGSKARAKQASLFDRAILRPATVDSFRKLHPRLMVRNPVMFVVWIGSIVTTFIFLRDLGSSTTKENLFAGLVALWLWFTVLFANF